MFLSISIDFSLCIWEWCISEMDSSHFLILFWSRKASESVDVIFKQAIWNCLKPKACNFIVRRPVTPFMRPIASAIFKDFSCKTKAEYGYFLALGRTWIYCW